MKKKSKAEVKVRLNKYISQSGLCSRREADNLIKKGHVKVNGSLCNELGSKVNINDLVQINNKPIKPEKNIYILLNKPKDYITSNKDTQNRKIVFDLIKGVKERIGVPFLKPVAGPPRVYTPFLAAQVQYPPHVAAVR